MPTPQLARAMGLAMQATIQMTVTMSLLFACVGGQQRNLPSTKPHGRWDSLQGHNAGANKTQILSWLASYKERASSQQPQQEQPGSVHRGAALPGCHGNRHVVHKAQRLNLVVTAADNTFKPSGCVLAPGERMLTCQPVPRSPLLQGRGCQCILLLSMRAHSHVQL